MDRLEDLELARQRVEQAQGCGHGRAGLTREPPEVKQRQVAASTEPSGDNLFTPCVHVSNKESTRA
jgi:hypothetical protein